MKNVKQQFTSIKQAGFTLVELIVVIVILGILSAFAIPKYIDLTRDANSAIVDGVSGALQSAANLVYARAVVEGVNKQPTAVVNMGDGTTIDTVYGYPAASASGIPEALQTVPTTHFVSHSAGGSTWQFTRNNGIANCAIRYFEATANSPARVIADSRCGSDDTSGGGSGGTPVVVPPADNGSGVISIG
ncbi:MAG: prepilin-type N-terminal cleavage/methylation domain-containing protein [Coxiellaceae bacterium]|nr:prepilin-type N-terminal cleavage/methylation domain-containing protein [Coxiellaceae bacterium]